MTFNWLDCVALFVIVMSAGLGANRGIIKDGLTLLGWIGGGFVALAAYKPVAIWLQAWIANEFLAQAVAFVGLILLSVIICILIAYIIAAGVKDGIFYQIDHVLGLFFGGIRGLAILVLAAFLLGKLDLTQAKWWQEAYCANHLTYLADKAQAWFPKVYNSIVKNDMEDL